MGRAGSPPTFACYEQIQYGDDDGSDDDDSLSESGSESDPEQEQLSADAGNGSEDEDADTYHTATSDSTPVHDDEHIQSMDVDSPQPSPSKGKGKQRATSPTPLMDSPTSNRSVSPNGGVIKSCSRAQRARQRSPRPQILRPILTIQRSQGFVWNQVSDRLTK